MKHYTLYTEVFDYIRSHNIVDTRELVHIFQKRQFTKQGLYKVLKRLREEGKILMRRTQVSINYVWLIREIRELSALLPLTFSLTHETYTHRRIYTMKTLTLPHNKKYDNIRVLLLCFFICT